jgi:hypothetical protein
LWTEEEARFVLELALMAVGGFLCGTSGSDLMDERRGIERMNEKEKKWEAKEEVFKFDRGLAL